MSDSTDPSPDPGLDSTQALAAALSALSESRKRFVVEVIKGASGVDAAQRAGYSPNNRKAAGVKAAELRKRPDVQAALAAVNAQRLATTSATLAASLVASADAEAELVVGAKVTRDEVLKAMRDIMLGIVPAPASARCAAADRICKMEGYDAPTRGKLELGGEVKHAHVAASVADRERIKHVPTEDLQARLTALRERRPS